MFSWVHDSPSRDARRYANARDRDLRGVGQILNKESYPRVSYINMKLPSQHLNKGNWVKEIEQ